MTIFEAARIIQAETQERWAICLSWAWDCRKERDAARTLKQTAVSDALASQRAAFFEKRRQELEIERYMARLRAAKLITRNDLEVKSTREGGWGMEKVYDIHEACAFGDAA